MYNSLELIELLKKQKYEIKVHQHDALFTVEDSKKLRGEIDGAHSKNLFLKNKKNEFFLISCEEADKINLKKIFPKLQTGGREQQFSLSQENKKRIEKIYSDDYFLVDNYL